MYDSLESLLSPNDCRKQSQCPYKLLNVLFSDAYAEEFAHLGDKADRKLLDTGKAGRDQGFYERVEDAFWDDDNREFGMLKFKEDKYFAKSEIDPGIIVNHNWKKLRAIWQQLNKTYQDAYRRFTKSGNNSSDFYEFCNGRKDVYYLRLLLHQKPQLHATVKAGLPDSCALTSDEAIPSARPTPRKTKDSGYESVVSALNSLADPEGKKRKMEILVREDARKQNEEERKDREEERKIRAEQREEKEHTMKEFEKVTLILPGTELFNTEHNITQSY